MGYDDTAAGYNELHGDEQAAKLRIIKEILKPQKGSRLLDIGCGTGISSDFECFAVGIDESIGMLKLNNSLMKLAASAEMLPFKTGSFDYVVSVTALHNFDSVIDAVSDMKRVGRNNFVFSVLRKSKKYAMISGVVEENFRIEKIIEEDKDTIFFCSRL